MTKANNAKSQGGHREAFEEWFLKELRDGAMKASLRQIKEMFERHVGGTISRERIRLYILRLTESGIVRKAPIEQKRFPPTFVYCLAQ